MVKNPRKIMRILSVLTVIIAVAAIAVGVVALDKQEYIIAAAMFLVAGWQIFNFVSWKKLR